MHDGIALPVGNILSWITGGVVQILTPSSPAAGGRRSRGRVQLSTSAPAAAPTLGARRCPGGARVGHSDRTLKPARDGARLPCSEEEAGVGGAQGTVLLIQQQRQQGLCLRLGDTVSASMHGGRPACINLDYEPALLDN